MFSHHVRDEKTGEPISDEDAALFDSIPEKVLQKAVIPMSSIGESEYSELIHSEERAEEFPYANYYANMNQAELIIEFLKTIEDVRGLAQGNPVYQLKIRGHLLGVFFTAEIDEHYSLKMSHYARFSSPMRELVGCYTHKELFEAHLGGFSSDKLTTTADIKSKYWILCSVGVGLSF